MNIEGKKVILRAMEKADMELVRKLFNSREVEHLVLGWSFPLSAYQQEKWFENNYNDRNNFRFVIDSIEDGPIGIATLTDIDWKNRRAYHGIKILPELNKHKGNGMDAVMALMRYAFDELQLVRLDGGWFEDNLPSKKLYTKCGWQEEGRKRKYVYQNGQYKDVIFTGILAEDYYRLVDENQYWQE